MYNPNQNTEKSLAQSAFWGTFWTLTDVIATKVLAFVIGIVLARLLSPEDFGIIGIIVVFTSLCDVIIESGTSNALIRKQNRTKSDCSMAFFMNVVVAIIIYGVLLLISPFVANFYNEPSIEILLRVTGINIIIYGLYIVPNALLIARFDIKKQAIVNFVANISSAAVAIGLAYNNFGIWTLVFQPLITNSIKCMGYWFCAKWKPVFEFSKESCGYLWNYTSKSLIIGLMGTFFANIYNLIIGKVFTKVELGFYARANQFSQLPSAIISATFTKISVASFGKLQDNKDHLCIVYRKYIHVILCISFSLLFFIVAVAEPLILFLLTDKWAFCIPMLRILSVGCAFSPLGTINLCLLQAINKIDYTLKLEFLKKTLNVILIAITIPMGLMAVIYGVAVYNVVATCLNLSCSKRFLGYKYKSQLLDILNYVVVAFISMILTQFAITLVDGNLIRLIAGTFCFWSVYIGVIFMMKFKVIEYVKELKQKI